MRREAEEREKKQSPLEQAAAFIVDKRKAFLSALYRAGDFLRGSKRLDRGQRRSDQLSAGHHGDPPGGLDTMEAEFTTFGTNRIMVDNIDYARAEQLSEQLETLDGVKSVEFDDTEDHYQNGAALFTVTYDGSSEDQVSPMPRNGCGKRWMATTHTSRETPAPRSRRPLPTRCRSSCWWPWSSSWWCCSLPPRPTWKCRCCW